MRKIFLITCVILIAFFMTATFYMNRYFNIALAQGTLYWGSSGDQVIQLQTKLKNWGYYDGPVDRIFGGKTFQAVKDLKSTDWRLTAL